MGAAFTLHACPWGIPGSAHQLAVPMVVGWLLGRAVGWPSIPHGSLGQAPGTTELTPSWLVLSQGTCADVRQSVRGGEAGALTALK